MNEVISPAGRHESILSSLRALLAACSGYLHARLRLLGLEAKEATTHFGWIGAFAAGILVLAFVGYLLLVLAVVFGIAAWIGGRSGYAWSTLAAAGIHLVLAGVLWALLRRKARERVFERSLDELKNDQQWLMQKPNR